MPRASKRTHPGGPYPLDSLPDSAHGQHTRLEVDMARSRCGVRPIGLVALSILLLAGCANERRDSYDNGDYDNGSYRPRPYGYRYYQPEALYQYRRHEFRSDGNYCYYHGCAPGNSY